MDNAFITLSWGASDLFTYTVQCWQAESKSHSFYFCFITTLHFSGSVKLAFLYVREQSSMSSFAGGVVTFGLTHQVLDTIDPVFTEPFRLPCTALLKIFQSTHDWKLRKPYSDLLRIFWLLILSLCSNAKFPTITILLNKQRSDGNLRYCMLQQASDEEIETNCHLNMCFSGTDFYWILFMSPAWPVITLLDL